MKSVESSVLAFINWEGTFAGSFADDDGIMSDALQFGTNAMRQCRFSATVSPSDEAFVDVFHALSSFFTGERRDSLWGQ
jgi:hypothetical protein